MKKQNCVGSNLRRNHAEILNIYEERKCRQLALAISGQYKANSQKTQPYIAPTNFNNPAQLAMLIFSFGTFLGENLLKPASSFLGTQTVLIAAAAVLLLIGGCAAHLNQVSQIQLIRTFYVLAMVASVVSILYSLFSGFSSPTSPEILNPARGVKLLLPALMSGIVLGVFSPNIDGMIAVARTLPVKIAAAVDTLFHRSNPHGDVRPMSSEEYLIEYCLSN